MVNPKHGPAAVVGGDAGGAKGNIQVQPAPERNVAGRHALQGGEGRAAEGDSVFAGWPRGLPGERRRGLAGEGIDTLANRFQELRDLEHVAVEIAAVEGGGGFQEDKEALGQGCGAGPFPVLFQ